MVRRSVAVAAFLTAAGLGALWGMQAPFTAPSDGPEAEATGASPDARFTARHQAKAAVGPHAPDAAAPVDGTWVSDQVLVRPVGDVYALARDTNASVVRPVGRSGFAALRVPDGVSPSAFLSDLRRAGRIVEGGPQARLRGATAQGEAPRPWPTGPLSMYQWGVAGSVPPSQVSSALPDVVVAVVDSGVAYADEVSQGGAVYAAAPSLAGSEIVAPWDFVEDDDTAYDEHQHGTHIASVIASEGEVVGMAPGAALMPLRVLDAHNQGLEIDLVEALYWAADHGADVINLSLSFGHGYAPSTALLDALAYADSSGAVLVGAAGNESHAQVAWPAASPQVIAVGSVCPNAAGDGPAFAPYGNTGPSLDLAAAGGCLDRDTWGGDGVVDGILAETIAPGSPDETGMWLMAGTSQAAAMVSGAAAHLVAAGHSPRVTRLALQASALKWHGHSGFTGGGGGGTLRLADALVYGPAIEAHPNIARADYHVGMMPYLQDNGDGTVTPSARVTVLDARTVGTDLPAKGVAETIVGRVTGPGGGPSSCTIGASEPGACTLRGAPVPLHRLDQAPARQLWRIGVDGVVFANAVAWRPSTVLYASDTLEGITDALQADPDLRDATLAFSWTGHRDSEVGPVAPALSLVHSGTGISTSPFGVVLTPRAAGAMGVVTESTLDGSGISTSPFGVVVLDVPPFDPVKGTGISTSPFGFRLVALDAEDALGGKGISTSPFGFKDLVARTETACVSGCVTFDADPILLGSSRIAVPVGVSTEGTATQAQLDAGGWSGEAGGCAVAGVAAEAGVELQRGAGLGAPVRFVAR